MIDGTTIVATALGMLCGGMMIGLLVGVATNNSDILKECQRQHNVYECVVIAIPKEKKETYEGKSK